VTFVQPDLSDGHANNSAVMLC